MAWSAAASSGVTACPHAIAEKAAANKIRARGMTKGYRRPRRGTSNPSSNDSWTVPPQTLHHARPMPSKRDVLEQLNRDELLAAMAQYELGARFVW